MGRFPPRSAPGARGGEGKLPEAAIAMLRAQPRFDDNPYVFPAARSVNGEDTCDERMVQAQAGARTPRSRSSSPACRNGSCTICAAQPRSLMSRAGVLSEHAERVMGHAHGAASKASTIGTPMSTRRPPPCGEAGLPNRAHRPQRFGAGRQFALNLGRKTEQGRVADAEGAGAALSGTQATGAEDPTRSAL